MDHIPTCESVQPVRGEMETWTHTDDSVIISALLYLDAVPDGCIFFMEEFVFCCLLQLDYTESRSFVDTCIFIVLVILMFVVLTAEI